MNMNLNDYENQINFENKAYQNNKMNLRNKQINYPINNIPKKNPQMNNNLILYDKRLVLCLKYLGLNNFISNFTKRGLKLEDFLSLSNSDLTALKIPPNVQDIIQKFMISYFNFGSMYTIEEIIQFFKTQKVARLANANERNNLNRNNIKYKSVNDNRRHSQNNNNKQNKNINNNIQRNMNQNNRNIDRPKSQKNKLINKANFFNTNIQNNFGKQTNTNINNLEQNQMVNFKTSNNNVNNIKRKNNKVNMCNNITNSNISSFQSSQNNFYSPSLDNFSHIAMKENSPQILNIMKMAKSKNININNMNQLKKNLVNNFQKQQKGKNNNNININNRNKKLIKDSKYESNILSRSTSKDIINRMNEVLKRCQSRKKSANTNSNLNMAKGYYSDENLNIKRKLQEQILTNNLNNINLDGYEINTYYAGDTSKFSSLYGNSNNNSLSSEIKHIKKGAKINSKINKTKKINEEQARKIEYLLSHGGNSSLKSGNNNLMMNNYMLNNDDELSVISRTNLTNYTNLTNNNNQKLFNKKNNYMNQANNNNNINSIKQKNLLIQRQNYKNKISKNKPNNFNTFASNRGNISSNYYQNNNNDDNIKLINNIIHIPNNQNRMQKNDGPVQISNINRKRINNNINIPSNYNNMMNAGENYSNQNNNSMSHYSMGQNNQYSNSNNLNNYPINKYTNNFISNNQPQQKRRMKSYDKQAKNRVYTGIHNINNNINNININNINYDGKRLSEGFNNFIDLDMKMNYHRTQNNFYNSNNLLNINDDYNDIY